jgi:LmbE family N-acetylglucosaminyl deacetylase
MQQDPCVVLSPHLDDAVLSAWHVLSAPRDVTAVTVFAGIPEPGFVTDLDRSHGAQESAAWVRQRRREDKTALALAGRTPLHLDQLEVQFLAFRDPEIRKLIASDPEHFLAYVSGQPTLDADADELADQIEARIPAVPVLYGPAGIGGHPDHRALARATVRLARSGRQVLLYADSPYYLARGLPSWLTGRPNPGADSRTEEALARLDLSGRSLTRQVSKLDDAAFEQKLAAMKRYQTEMPAIAADLNRAPAGPDAMRYETNWILGDDKR